MKIVRPPDDDPTRPPPKVDHARREFGRTLRRIVIGWLIAVVLFFLALGVFPRIGVDIPPVIVFVAMGAIMVAAVLVGADRVKAAEAETEDDDWSA